VAVNCCVLPTQTEGLAGVTTIEIRVAFDIVNDRITLRVLGELLESVTLNVSEVLLIAWLGVPLITPVAALNINPLGIIPLTSDHL